MVDELPVVSPAESLAESPAETSEFITRKRAGLFSESSDAADVGMKRGKVADGIDGDVVVQKAGGDVGGVADGDVGGDRRVGDNIDKFPVIPLQSIQSSSAVMPYLRRVATYSEVAIRGLFRSNEFNNKK